jgi:hypothetical protein
MTSETKINSNRLNARYSTGPKSKSGRVRSSRNARRHGLTIPVTIDPVFAEDIHLLALEIAGSYSLTDVSEDVREIAQAQVELLRIRRLKHQLSEIFMRECNSNADKVVSGRLPGDRVTDVMDSLLRLKRYERRAQSRRKSAIRELDLWRASSPVRLAQRSQKP